MSNSILATEIDRYYVESPSQLIGDVAHLYFNDNDWKVSFLGINAGERLIRKHILIPTFYVKQLDVSSRRIFLKEDLDPHTEVLAEKDLPNHHHNTRDLKGFKLISFEKPVGKVADLLLNRESWKIEALIIQFHIHLKEKHVSIPLNQIKTILWKDEKIKTSLHQQEILNSPEFTDERLHVGSRQLFG